MSLTQRLVLVVGATGAQGIAVVEALLRPERDGTPSPYRVRIFTRDAEHPRSKRLAALDGVEVAIGSVKDLQSVEQALEGVYGAFINTDGFTIGEKEETIAGLRIFELAKIAGVKHYVWSNLDYGLKKGNYDPQYRCAHYDAKGRVAEWIGAQPSEADGLRWSVLTTGPYMDMLFHLFAPLGQRPDGTFVFSSPVGDGHVPMVALSDIGFFSRYIFDNPDKTSGKDLEIASDIVGWDYLVETFIRVSGQKAVFYRATLEEYMDVLKDIDEPVGVEDEPGSITWRVNFSGWWSLWRDDIVKRDMDWVRSINPNTVSLEEYMRKENYQGGRRPLLKITERHQESGKPGVNREKAAQILGRA